MKKKCLVSMVLTVIIALAGSASALETQTFDDAASAAAAGWTTSGTGLGWSDSDETGGASGAGEAGGIWYDHLPSRSEYYADTTIGTLGLSDALTASGELTLTGSVGTGLESGFIGFFDSSATGFENSLGIYFVDDDVADQRAKLIMRLGDDTAILSPRANDIGLYHNQDYTFTFTWDPGTARLSLEIFNGATSVGNTAIELDAGQVAGFGSLDAFGMGNVEDYSPWGGNQYLTLTGYMDRVTYTSNSGLPYDPIPEDFGIFVDTDTLLSWTGSIYPAWNLYDVWFGTDPNSNMEKIVDKQNVLSADPEAHSEVTGALANETTYYWRVDVYEPNTPVDILHKGSLWSFMTGPPNPVITSDPAEQVVAASSTAEFTVTAINTDTYYWYKVGTPDVLVATHPNTSGTDTLTITNVQSSDEGSYYCVAENIDSADTSGAADLWLHQLIGKWNFDDPGTPAVAADTSGFGNDGVILPEATYVYDGNIYALEFNNDPNSYVEVPPAALDPLGDQISIILWQYGADSQPQNQYVFNAEKSSGDIRFRANIPNLSGSIFWECPQGVLANNFATSDQYKGAWHQWCFTKNATTGVMQIYLDGVLWHSETDLDTLEFSSDIARFTIGGPGAPTTQNYEGRIAGFRVFNYVLDAVDVAQEYFNDSGQAVCDVNTKPVGDLTGDCLVNLDDVARLAQDWLGCTLLPISECP
jgi:hypothetical protein